MLDETIRLEAPPLTSCYGRIGEPHRIFISGNPSKRFLHGALNIQRGDVLLWHRSKWTQVEPQTFLHMVRSHWRGWQMVLFEDRATPHQAAASQELAAPLGLHLRFLPRATPELNAMEHLWRHLKREGLSNRETSSVQQSAEVACRYILGLSPRERLRKAGVSSGNFWLTL
jgi:transposase